MSSTVPTARSCAASRRPKRPAATAPDPQGVPGALTNQPPTPGVALPPGATAAAARSCERRSRQLQPAHGRRTAPPPPDNTSKQSTRNYEIDRTVAYTKQPAGRLKRLTVAVLVDNLRTTGRGRQGHRDCR